MTEIILQTWSDLNMAGYEWRREVYATSNGTHWSIKARQIDENTGQAYRVRGVYRLKSARGVVAGLDRVFRNDHHGKPRRSGRGQTVIQVGSVLECSA